MPANLRALDDYISTIVPVHKFPHSNEYDLERAMTVARGQLLPQLLSRGWVDSGRRTIVPNLCTYAELKEGIAGGQAVVEFVVGLLKPKYDC